MKSYTYENLNSTSLEAARLVKQNNSLPFAVTSAQQSQGKGRQGKTWLSPKGNLYLSFALTPPKKVSKILPLKVGALISLWLKEELGLSITLKWPNDLVFKGQKLGGILCEATWQKNQISCLIVGIGINVAHAPKIKDYQSCCLNELTSKHFCVDQLTKSLIAYWQKHWSFLDDKKALQLYQSHHLPVGQLWWNQSEKVFYKDHGISKQGSLITQNLITRKFIEQSSAHHPLTLYYGATATSSS